MLVDMLTFTLSPIRSLRNRYKLRLLKKYYRECEGESKQFVAAVIFRIRTLRGVVHDRFCTLLFICVSVTSAASKYSTQIGTAGYQLKSRTLL